MPDEPYMDSVTKDVHDEIEAISAAYEALRSLSSAGQLRAMRWLASKLGTEQEASTR
jgi:hypothetical protein